MSALLELHSNLYSCILPWYRLHGFSVVSSVFCGALLQTSLNLCVLAQSLPRGMPAFGMSARSSADGASLRQNLRARAARWLP